MSSSDNTIDDGPATTGATTGGTAGPSTGATIEVRNEAQRSRYEVTVDGDLAGFAVYSAVAGDRIIFTHTEIAPEFEGRGLATRLIADALADARDREQKIIPICPFVTKYVHAHPEYIPFLDERIRRTFE